MRTLNKLYTILWNEIKDRSSIYSLCHEIDCLYKYKIITHSERRKLWTHFHKNKPTKNLHSEFLKNDTWIGTAWWWNSKESSNPINRKAFVQKMIKITKPKKRKK